MLINKYQKINLKERRIMKKIMILTLMLVMMFSLTACGNKEKNNTNNN